MCHRPPKAEKFWSKQFLPDFMECHPAPFFRWRHDAFRLQLIHQCSDRGQNKIAKISSAVVASVALGTSFRLMTS